MGGLLEADALAHPSPLLRAWIHFADVAIQLGDRHLAVWKRTKTPPACGNIPSVIAGEDALCSRPGFAVVRVSSAHDFFLE